MSEDIFARSKRNMDAVATAGGWGGSEIPNPQQPAEPSSEGWQIVEKVQKNEQGQYRALVKGEWMPAIKAQKNDAGEYRAILSSPSISAMDVVKTFGHLAIPGGAALKAADLMTQGATEAGGIVTDVTGSPAAGLATNVALQAAPMVAGGALAKVAAPALRGTAEYLMQSAMKPTLKQLKSGEAATAIDTMLNEGLNVTKGGVEKLKEKLGDLNKQISEAIANSPETVKVGEVGKALVDTMKRFQNQVNPQMDIQTIKNAWGMFKDHPLINGAADIPVQLAQQLKQGTYRILSKKYGQLSSAEEEAQKGIARGLKDEISSAVPEVAGLNAEESKLIQALNVSERRALMDLNRNPGGLAYLTHNPASFMAYMADKSALFKSLAARMLNTGKEQIPATAARLGIAGYEVNQE